MRRILDAVALFISKKPHVPFLKEVTKSRVPQIQFNEQLQTHNTVEHITSGCRNLAGYSAYNTDVKIIHYVYVQCSVILVYTLFYKEPLCKEPTCRQPKYIRNLNY